MSRELTDKSLNLIRNSVQVYAETESERIAEMEQHISMYIWMYRNNVDRKDVISNLTELVDHASVEAAKAVIQLKIGMDTGDSTLDVFKEATSGKT